MPERCRHKWGKNREVRKAGIRRRNRKFAGRNGKSGFCRFRLLHKRDGPGFSVDGQDNDSTSGRSSRGQSRSEPGKQTGPEHRRNRRAKSANSGPHGTASPGRFRDRGRCFWGAPSPTKRDCRSRGGTTHWPVGCPGPGNLPARLQSGHIPPRDSIRFWTFRELTVGSPSPQGSFETEIRKIARGFEETPGIAKREGNILKKSARKK